MLFYRGGKNNNKQGKKQKQKGIKYVLDVFLQVQTNRTKLAPASKSLNI